MWALGTILGELIGRTPMYPGSDSISQIDLIIQYLGNILVFFKYITYYYYYYYYYYCYCYCGYSITLIVITTLVIYYIGKPSASFIEQCQKPSFRQYLRQQADVSPIKIDELYTDYISKYKSHVFDLLTHLLAYDPCLRYSAADSLKHPYLFSLNK